MAERVIKKTVALLVLVLTIAGSGWANPVWAAFITSGNSQWTTTGSGIYYNGGNVGIGTSTTLRRLQIEGGYPGFVTNRQGNYVHDFANSLYTLRNIGGARGLEFRANINSSFGGRISGIAGGLLFSGNGGAANHLSILTDGNVGIGLTNPAKPLEVSGESKFGSFARGVTPIATDTLALTTVEYVNSKTGGSGGVGAGTTGQTLRHDGTGWVANSILYNNGTNVGVGASNPQAKLHVAGKARFEDVGSGRYIEFDINSGNQGILTSAGNLNIMPATGAANIYKSGAAASLQFYDGSSTYPVFIRAAGNSYFNGGNVGIGIANPSKLLDVHGQAKFNSFAYGTTPISTDTLALTTVEYVNAKTGGSGGVGAGTTGQTLRHDGTGWVANSTIYNNGTNVGIGTTGPGAKLEIYDTNPSLRLSGNGNNLDDNPYGSIEFYNRDSTGSGPQVTAKIEVRSDNSGFNYGRAGQLAFYTAPSTGVEGADPIERLRITEYGNVGIGTTNPTQKLHVVGNVQVELGNMVYFRDTNTYINEGSGLNIVAGSGRSINLAGGTGTDMTIASAGNVGIGIVGPTKLLEVNGQGKFNSFVYGTTPVTTDTLALTTVEYVEGRMVNGGGPWSRTGTRTYLTTNNDNVGIGTTAPGAGLNIISTTNPQFESRYADTSAAYIKLFSDAANAGITINKNGGNRGGSVYFNTGTYASNSLAWGIGMSDSDSAGDGTEFYIGQTAGGANANFWIETNGNVGIGTTSPSGLLHLSQNSTYVEGIIENTNSGSSAAGFAFRRPGQSWQLGINNVNAFRLRDETNNRIVALIESGAPANSFYLNSLGNLGIGTSNPSYAKLQIMGSTALSISHDATSRLTISTDGSRNYFAGVSGQGHRFTTTGGAIFEIQNGGNIGVGLTNPAKLLEVNGQGKFNSFTYGVTPVSTDTLALTTVEYVNAKTGGAGGVGSGTTGQTLRHDGTGWVGNSALYNNGTNIGIGSTNPSQKLSIYNASSAATMINIANQDETSGFSIGLDSSESGWFGTVGNRDMKINANNTEVMRIKAGGNVGIGVTNPGQKLVVEGNVQVNSNLNVAGPTDSTRYINLRYNGISWPDYASYFAQTGANDIAGTRGLIINTNIGQAVSNYGISLSIASSSKLFVQHSGNVGISLVNPTKLLDVNGQAKFGGFAYGVTPVATDNLALTTVEYVNAKTGGSGGVGAGTSGQTLRHDGTGWVANSNLFNNGTNIGIGTANPTATLQVGTSNSSIRLGAYTQIFELPSVSAGDSWFYFGRIDNSSGNYSVEAIAEGVRRGANPGGNGSLALSVSQYNGSATHHHSYQGSLKDGNMGYFAIYSDGTNYHLYYLSKRYSAPTIRFNSTYRLLSSPVAQDPSGTLVYTTNANSTAYLQGIHLGRHIAYTGDSAAEPAYTWSGNENLGLFRPTADVLAVSTQGTEKMRIVASGSVGIGTTNPTKLLEVNGQGKFNNFAYGVTPSQADLLALTTVEFVTGLINSSTSTVGNKWTKDGDTVGSIKKFGTIDSFDLPIITANTERMRITSNGNVGIGTTAPAQRLEVNGSIINRGILYQYTSLGQGSGARGISWYQPSYVTWFDYMAPAGGTNAPSGAAAPSDASSGVTSWARRFNIENSSNYGWIFESGTNTSGNAPTVKFSINAGSGTFHTIGNGIIDGNLGIGTTNPAAKLEVRHANTSTDPNTSNYPLRLYNNSWSGNQITGMEFWNGSNKVVPTARIISQMNGSGAGGENMHFQTQPSSVTNPNPNQPTTKLTILADGNVGVGQTTPTKLLHVNGQAIFGNFAYGVTPVFTDDLALTTVEYVNASGPWQRSGTQVTLRNTGDSVGIGTTNPGYKLDVNGSIGIAYQSNLAFRSANGSSYKQINVDDGTSGYYTFRYISNGGDADSNVMHQWLTNKGGASNTAVMSLTRGGNVGIGTTNPGNYSLKVVGNVAITGTLETQTGSDFAEEFRSQEVLEPGTVVIMGDEGYKSVKMSRKAHDTQVVGVVSDNPSIIAGRSAEKNGNQAIVAMVGVVKVKVTDANGSIRRGDLLTSAALAGHAMKTDGSRPGTIIGKALEDLNGKTGEIKVLINLQ